MAKVHYFCLQHKNEGQKVHRSENWPFLMSQRASLIKLSPPPKTTLWLPSFCKHKQRAYKDFFFLASSRMKSKDLKITSNMRPSDRVTRNGEFSSPVGAAIFVSSVVRHRPARLAIGTHVSHAHLGAQISISGDVIGSDWNRFGGLSVVAATFISPRPSRQDVTAGEGSRVISSVKQRSGGASRRPRLENEATGCAGIACHTYRSVSCLARL